MTVIAAEGLTRRFGAVEAVRGIDLEVRTGECLGLLGHNGAGKTTTIKLLLGLLQPTAGRAEVLGHPPGHMAIRRRVGYSPETPHFYPFLTAREMIRFYARLGGVPLSRSGAEAILEQVGLAGAADARVGGFSKGMVQRLAVAQALIGQPEVLFLDEPSSGLDPAGRVEMRALIRRLREEGRTVFLNTHILADVEAVADRVIVMKRGRIAAVEDLRAPATAGVVARVTDLTPTALEGLRQRFGLQAAFDGQSLTLAGLRDGQEPEVLAYLVQTGARVYSFAPQRVSLEQRFLRLMEGGDGDDAGVERPA